MSGRSMTRRRSRGAAHGRRSGRGDRRSIVASIAGTRWRRSRARAWRGACSAFIHKPHIVISRRVDLCRAQDPRGHRFARASSMTVSPCRHRLRPNRTGGQRRRSVRSRWPWIGTLAEIGVGASCLFLGPGRAELALSRARSFTLWLWGPGDARGVDRLIPGGRSSPRVSACCCAKRWRRRSGLDSHHRLEPTAWRFRIDPRQVGGSVAGWSSSSSRNRNHSGACLAQLEHRPASRPVSAPPGISWNWRTARGPNPGHVGLATWRHSLLWRASG